MKVYRHRHANDPNGYANDCDASRRYTRFFRRPPCEGRQTEKSVKVYPPFTSPVDSKNKNFCEGRLTNKIETVGWRSHFCDGILAKNVKVGRPSPFSPALHMCDGRPTFCPLSPLLHRCDGRLTKKCDGRLTIFSLSHSLVHLRGVRR